VTMEVETKFLRLFKPVAIGDRIDGWHVCWVGGWDKCRVVFVVMVERLQRGGRRPARKSVAQEGAMIPASPGTYALVLRCSTTRTVRIGRIGTIRLMPGWYVYIGSAFGPGGLRARIGHHTARAARPHWHIDHLRPLHPLGMRMV
jgi:Domain of unknown function DUF123